MSQTDPDPKTGTGDIAVHVRIEGKVQGVWYRAWTVEQATKRGLTGWVRNRRDGTVEAVFCGAPETVQAMIAACHDGPPHASVTRVHDEPTHEDGTSGFQKLPTE